MLDIVSSHDRRDTQCREEHPCELGGGGGGGRDLPCIGNDVVFLTKGTSGLPA
jgi:hypothetical protein